jgi:hypothetical protein
VPDFTAQLDQVANLSTPGISKARDRVETYPHPREYAFYSADGTFRGATVAPDSSVFV